MKIIAYYIMELIKDLQKVFISYFIPLKMCGGGVPLVFAFNLGVINLYTR